MNKGNGLADLIKALNSIPQTVRKRIQPAIDQGADEMVDRMRYLVPENEGELKAGIKAERSKTVPLATRVSAIDETTNTPGFDNALAQEYGVLHMPGQTRGKNAQPFFWATVNTTKKRVRRRIDRAIRKAIEEAWK
ncbi:MAG: HK97 gp10 family phage protein [Pseudaminobacter sp.]|nr:HK97 gp10 family phage protein [Pseudaminobacter sp.]